MDATTTGPVLLSASTPVVAPKSTITKPPQMTDEFAPQCGAPTYPYTKTMIGDPTCFENHAHIELLYWPVVRLPENETCPNATSSTLTMGPTISGRPNTFVYWNTTLTSPTVYMAVGDTWIYQSAGSTISDQSRLLIPQSPDAVSTLAGKLGGGYHPPEKINYADFNYPVPASAYRAQPRCYEAPFSRSYYTVTQPLFPGGPTTTWEVETHSEFASENQCSTIYDDYRPILSIPPEFSSLTPAAQRGHIPCPFSFGTDAVFFDPPKALTQADSLDGVSRPGSQSTDEATTTKEAPSQSAEPGTLPGPETPSATLTSETTAASKTTQAQTSATSERPKTSAEDGSQVQTPDPTGFSNRDPQLTSEADPQTTRDPVSSVADDSDNGATETNTAGIGEDDQSQVQTSARPNSGATQSSSPDGADSQPTSNGSGSTVGSTTSRNVGEIIASVLGMTSTQSAEGSPTSTATSGNREDSQGQDSSTQSSTKSNQDSGSDSQASDAILGGTSGASASDGSHSDNAGSSSTGDIENTDSGSGTAGTSDDQSSSDTTSDSDASAGSSNGDKEAQSDNTGSSSTGDVEATGSGSDSNDTAGDQSSGDTTSDSDASAGSSNGDSGSSSSGGADDSAQGQTGSSSGSGSDNDASGSQSGDKSSGSSSDAENVANSQGQEDEASTANSDTSGSQAGATGSAGSGSTAQVNSYTAAVISGFDTLMTISPAASGGAVITDATLSPGESTNVPGIGNLVAISSGVIADGSTAAFSPLDTGAASSGVVTGVVLSRPSDPAITISQASGGGAVVGSATLSSGEQTYVSGMGNIVVQSSGVVVDGSTLAYSTITSRPESNSVTDGDARAQEFTVDGKTYTASSATGGDIVIANDLSTATIDAAGDLATIGTVIMSAGSSGQLMLGSSTVPMTAAPTASAFTAGQQTFTAGSDGDYLFGSQTLIAGGAVTMSGTTYSRPTSGSEVVVNGVTQGLETGRSSESGSQSGVLSSTSSSSGEGQEGSGFIVPAATAESTTSASGADRMSAVGGMAGIIVVMALLNAM
ncbi:hypothetical protein KC316_g2446 [Hortaea werneckii]|nr:hypothetical protein KC324_g1908 [Hortaea werneckii]KAI7592172.1 hypothetical protein KC316_g2446 [Hortaea werneckii]